MGRSELQPGTILHFPGGRSYEILETIGGGGSALLYEAKALNSEQRLAIKELYPIDGYLRRDGAIVPAVGNGGELAEWKKTLEQREIRLSQRAGRRNHQVVFGLPPVWHRVDLELPDGRRFDGVENTYVRMESLREKGILLNDYLRTAREKDGLTLDSALDIMETVLDAYAALHADGFIHGDCQMGNVFLLRAGRRPGIAVIIDFDAARELERDGLSAAVTGDVFATDGYCAPELLLREEGLRLSPACDVWALGFLLLELLTDRGMEEQRDLTAYLVCHPGECRLSRREGRKLGCTAAQIGLLNDILARAMALPPGERFADAGEMREALVALRHLRELELYGEISKWHLWERLRALAAWMARTQRACFDREELSQWLKQNAGAGTEEELSAEQFLYYGTERLAVLVQVDGKFRFEEAARTVLLTGCDPL